MRSVEHERVRPMGVPVQISATDACEQYAIPGGATTPFSPPPSRHNSINGIDVPVPTGPAPLTRDGRRIDHYRPSSLQDARRESLDRRASNGVRKPGDTGASPLLQTGSPRSLRHGETETPGSGNSTPQHVAPPAPSMRTTASSSATLSTGARLSLQTIASVVNMANAEYYNSRLDEHEKLESSVSGTVSSLLSIRARKRAQATKEHETQKLKGGESVFQMIQAVIPEKSGVEVLSNKDRTTYNQMQAKTMGLQIEVTRLKEERDKMLHRLDELEKLNSLHKEMQTFSARLGPLEKVPQQLTTLSFLPLSVDQLRTTLDDLSQWRHSTEPALQAIKADIAAQRGQMSQSSSPDVLTLLDFKKQIEKENWPNQLRVAKVRMEEVAKNEEATHEGLKGVEKALKKDVKLLEKKVKDEIERAEKKSKDEIERAERKVDDKFKQLDEKVDGRTEMRLNKFEEDLVKCNGPMQPEYGRTGKTVLDRVQELESTYDQLRTVQRKQDKMSNDLRDIKREIEDITTSLSKTAAGAKAVKDPDNRLDALQTALKALRKATDAREQSEQRMVADILEQGKRIHDVEQSQFSVKEASAMVASIEPRISSAERSLPLIKEVGAKIVNMETHMNSVSNRINSIESNHGDLTQRCVELEGELTQASNSGTVLTPF
jgi:DNA repair exonuclease SbcCD ATPase subunit